MTQAASPKRRFMPEPEFDTTILDGEQELRSPRTVLSNIGACVVTKDLAGRSPLPCTPARAICWPASAERHLVSRYPDPRLSEAAVTAERLRALLADLLVPSEGASPARPARE